MGQALSSAEWSQTDPVSKSGRRSKTGRSTGATQFGGKKSAAPKAVSATKNCTYILRGVFPLDFFARFGYDMHYGNETRDLLVQFSGGCNERILSRDLASIRVQQETEPVSDHCELCRSVLTAPALFQAIVSRQLRAAFFMRPTI